MDKNTIINLAILAPLLIALAVYYTREHQKQKNIQKGGVPKRNNDGAEFVERLTQLGYFDFTSPKVLDQLILEIRNGYEQHGELATIDIDDQPVCNRLFSADAEYLCEEGGIINTLPGLKMAFEIRKLKFDIQAHFEEYQNNLANQWVVINGRKYFIYENIQDAQVNWDVATNALVDLLNQELKIQTFDEHVYLISGGNDAKLIFLTSEQYDFINSLNIRDGFKPYQV